ncbi:hypothetical protein [Escherichia coli]|uniref:hypothetical protein n=1 Tax=Escherichia coli TaxID=562 RepID=UPI00388FF0EC
MDVFIDLDKSIDERSFVAKFDLNADFLGRYAKKKKRPKGHLFSTGFCFGKREIRQNLTKNNVTVINISDSEIKHILDYYDTTVEMIINNNISTKLKEHLTEFFRSKLGNLNPDVIIYWEYCSDIFSDLFKDSIFLEGSHTGFWRLENKNPDVLFNVSTKNEKYEDVFIESIKKLKYLRRILLRYKT